MPSCTYSDARGPKTRGKSPAASRFVALRTHSVASPRTPQRSRATSLSNAYQPTGCEAVAGFRGQISLGPRTTGSSAQPLREAALPSAIPPSSGRGSRLCGLSLQPRAPAARQPKWCQLRRGRSTPILLHRNQLRAYCGQIFRRRLKLIHYFGAGSAKFRQTFTRCFSRIWESSAQCSPMVPRTAWAGEH